MEGSIKYIFLALLIIGVVAAHAQLDGPVGPPNDNPEREPPRKKSTKKDSQTPKKPLFPNLFLPEVKNPYYTNPDSQSQNQGCGDPNNRQDRTYQQPQPYPNYQVPSSPYPQQQPYYSQYPQPQNQQPAPYNAYPGGYGFVPPPPPQQQPQTLFPAPSDRSGRGRALNFQNIPEPQGLSLSKLVEPDQPTTKPKNPYLTPPVLQYKIGIVADLGKDARVGEGKFQSFFKEGNLVLQKNPNEPGKFNVTVEFDEEAQPQIIYSGWNNNNEGFELSTLNVFNGKLYSCDDETGIVYELVQDEKNNNTWAAKPWAILTLSDTNTGFKCEWATVKDEHLWVGSTGILIKKRDDTNTKDKSRQWVKKIAPNGQISEVDWSKNYAKLSDAIGIQEDKGFAVHESVAWSDNLQKWLFAPRRISREKFNKEVYHKKAGNTAVFVGDDFDNFKMQDIGEVNNKTSGFTSIKFIPGTEDQLILALKAGFDKEANDLFSTLEVFDVNGEEVMPEIRIAKGIYAGVEFI